MSSIPVHAYSSPKIRRAMLGQRKSTSNDNESKPLEIVTVRPPPSPLASPSPTSTVKSMFAVSSSETPKKVSFLSSTPMTQALPMAKSDTNEPLSGSLLQSVKPYFTPPLARKLMQFRSISVQPGLQQSAKTVQKSGKVGADSFAVNDDAINFQFLSSELALSSGDQRRNRFISSDQ